MADKYISIGVTGIETEVEATVTSGGAANAGDIVALGSDGRLDPSMMPVGVGADAVSLTAGEALNAGDFVYVVPGTQTVRKASAAAGGNPARGFVLTSAANAASVLVYWEGSNTALTGLTIGSRYYLSDTAAGGVTTTPVTGTGKLHQFIGYAYSTSAITTEIADHIVRA
jgi:hypothetical protein